MDTRIERAFDVYIEIGHDFESIFHRQSRTFSLCQLAKSRPATRSRIIAALVTSLDDVDGRLRQQAAECLGRLAAREAIPQLRELLDDEYGPARAKAAWALFKLTDDVEPSLGVLIELLRAEDLESRFAAAVALAAFDRRASAAIPALLENNLYDGRPPFTNWKSFQRSRLKSAADSALKALQ